MSYFVTGTDTGVGKTLVSAVLVKLLEHKNPLYLKPLQTGALIADGVRASEDITTVNQLTGQHFIEEESCFELLDAPLAPFAAAKLENKTIDFDALTTWTKQHKSKDVPLIIEGAGGVMVPITKDKLMIDLMSACGLPVIVVARPSLGTINHTLLTLEALQRRMIPIAGFVISDNLGDEKTIISNKQQIESYSHTTCLGIIANINSAEKISLDLCKSWLHLAG